MSKKYTFLILFLSVLTLSACNRQDTAKKADTPSTATVTPTPAPAPSSSVSTGVTVSTITLANAIGSDKKPTNATETFGVKDTIYVSVDSTGAGTAPIKAKWTYRKNGEETLVKEDVQTITASGPSTTEFHISKPDGWPTGDYRVEIFVADNSAGSKNFTVK